MNKIEFKSKVAQRIYNDYMKRVDSVLKVLNPKDREELWMEINSHIYEYLEHNKNQEELDEAELLLDVTERLGKPETYLKTEIAGKKLEEATKSFNPRAVFQAVFLNIGRGIRNTIVYSTFFILYLFLFGFVALAVIKIFEPENTGLFFKEGKFHALAYLSDANGLNEVLGYWFIPAMLALGVLFYLIITLLMRLTRKK